MKLIEYLAFAVTVVSSTLCVGPLPRSSIYVFFIISMCWCELLSTPKIDLTSKKSESESNSILYPQYEYLPSLELFVSAAALIKQPIYVKLVPKSSEQISY